MTLVNGGSSPLIPARSPAPPYYQPKWLRPSRPSPYSGASRRCGGARRVMNAVRGTKPPCGASGFTLEQTSKTSVSEVVG